jgi:D,D-heptose 1,7-bisphosphate phosphatase
MKAVILAGGKGTRLGNLTASIPKPMVELAGKPIVQYQVELCQRFGIEEIIFIVNHLGDALEQHFGNGSDFGIPISYFHEEKPLGTVGGLVEIKDRLQKDFLVLYGDVMMEMDLSRLWSFHQTKKSDATLVVHPNDHPYDSDLIEMNEDQQVIKVLPKPHPDGLRYHNMVNAAVYLFKPMIFEYLEEGVKADFGRDVFPRIYDKIRMYGYNTPEYLKDMGTPDRLEQVEKDVRSGKVSRRSLTHRQKALFLDRDGVLNIDTDLIHRPEDLELYPFTAEAIRRINKSDYLSVITTNQSVVARNMTTIEGLAEIHKKMETELGEAGAKLDDIRYCPHHPDKGFPEENPAYKIDCNCRKPKPGMLTDAAQLFNIDLSISWMIGDSERDTLAGRAAGCTTIGVMTGHGHRKAEVLPDYFFANLAEAVDFILAEPWERELQVCNEKLKVWQNAHPDQPFVIAIAGNSRSGKSTFSTRLKKFLEAEKNEVKVIRLDDWIRPKHERRERDEVHYNFQSERLQHEIRQILKGERIELSSYPSHPARPVKPKTYQIDNPDVIILDGVVGLATEALRSLSQYKVFMKIEEGELKQRFEAFYNWKGMAQDEMEQLWQIRLENEYKVIAEHHKYADLVIG